MPVQVTIDVEYCSKCPFGKVKGPIWDKDIEEDIYDIHCNMLHENVHESMHWSEVASECKSGKGFDTPPNSCPFPRNLTACRPDSVAKSISQEKLLNKIKPSSLI